jgi:hypothetical protein
MHGKHNAGTVLVFALAAALAQLCPMTSVEAQQAAPTGNCEIAAAAEPATPTDRSADSGTKNMGSTGWSGGGMGGSHNDTTPSGPTASSPSDQPATAKGLDPTKPDGRRGQAC